MRRFPRKYFFITVFLVSGLAFLNYQGWLSGPESFFLKTSAPFQKASYSFNASLDKVFSFLQNVSDLEKTNQELENKNLKLEGKVAQLKEVVKENEFLRKQISLENNFKNELILAQIIGYDSVNSSRCLLIDKGLSDGLRKDMPVISAGNVLVGRILEASDSFSKVVLITDSSSLVNAFVQDSRLKGVVKGNGSGEVLIDLVLQEEDLTIGQAVVTSGLSGVFPAGLLIGQINNIFADDPEIFQKAAIEPAVDFQGLEKAFVILK